jgi:hypothetical protein
VKGLIPPLYSITFITLKKKKKKRVRWNIGFRDTHTTGISYRFVNAGEAQITNNRGVSPTCEGLAFPGGRINGREVDDERNHCPSDKSRPPGGHATRNGRAATITRWSHPCVLAMDGISKPERKIAKSLELELSGQV